MLFFRVMSRNLWLGLPDLAARAQGRGETSPIRSRRCQRHSISAATIASATASPIQMPMPASGGPEAERDRQRQPDRPVAEPGIDHRDAGVAEPAQQAGADDLRAIDDLEDRRIEQEASSPAPRPRPRPAWSCRGRAATSSCGASQHHQRRQRHEADAEHDRHRAGPRDAVAVAGAEGPPDPHRRRPGRCPSAP